MQLHVQHHRYISTSFAHHQLQVFKQPFFSVHQPYQPTKPQVTAPQTSHLWELSHRAAWTAGASVEELSAADHLSAAPRCRGKSTGSTSASSSGRQERLFIPGWSSVDFLWHLGTAMIVLVNLKGRKSRLMSFGEKRNTWCQLIGLIVSCMIREGQGLTSVYTCLNYATNPA